MKSLPSPVHAFPPGSGALLRRLGCFVLVLSALLLLGPERAAAVDLDALVGFGPGSSLPSRYRPNTWTPLTVYLTGTGVNGVGQLQLAVRIGERTTLYTRRVPLHEGALNEQQRFVFLPRMAYGMFGFGPNNTSTDITVRLLMEGRKLAEKTVALPTALTPESYNILALTRDGSGLNFLLKKKLNLIHRHFNPAVLTNMNGANPNVFAMTQVLYSDPRALPEMAQGYDMVDAIALADQPLDNLTEDQQEAIKEYVRRGGLLIVSGGGDLPRLKGEFFTDLLPVQPTGTVTTRSLPALEQRYHQPLVLKEASLLADGALKPDARALFGPGPGRLPLVSARPYDAGVVVFTAFDYLAPEFRGWAGAPTLWADLLRCGNEALSARGLLASASGYNYGYFRSAPALADALAGQQAANTPALATILVFLGAYIVLLVPVSYYILKRLDKRELAWFTAPVLILGFTVASYMIAQSIKGGMLVVNRAVVLETSANSDQAAGYAQMTLYSPARATYNIALAPDAPDAAYRDAAPSEIYTSDPGLGDTLTIDHDKTTTLRDVPIKLWDKRSFDTPVFARLGGPVEVHTQYLGGNHVQVRVTNKTRYALTDCALVTTNSIARLGDLGPGETKQKIMLWSTGNGAGQLSVPSSSVSTEPGSNASATDKQAAARAKIQAGMAQALTGSAENTPYRMYGDDEDDDRYGHATNAFIGWFYDPVLNVTVNDRAPAGEEVNLLFVHLPTPENGPQTLRVAANPFLAPARTLEDATPFGGAHQGIFK